MTAEITTTESPTAPSGPSSGSDRNPVVRFLKSPRLARALFPLVVIGWCVQAGKYSLVEFVEFLLGELCAGIFVASIMLAEDITGNLVRPSKRLVGFL